MTRNFFFHFRPAFVSKRTLRFTLSWGLGGMAAALVLIQLATGLLLQFAYDPTPVGAYTSVQTIIRDVPFGRLVRNAHYLAANLLVLLAFLHMLRVFFTGALYGPRRLNWIIGLIMFGLVLGANFTGYLLPWDQLAFWAVTVSTGMLTYIPLIGEGLHKAVLGGSHMGPQTLLLFYALHTAVLPVFLIGFMAFHFWRVRKAGGLVTPKPSLPASSRAGDRVPGNPDLFVREAAVASALLAVVLVGAVFFDAPLGDPANPGLSPNPTKAPWYFAGFQEILLHLHPIHAVFGVPLVMGLFLLLLPFVKHDARHAGEWFVSKKGRRMAVMAVLTAVLAAFGLIGISECGILPNETPGGGFSMMRTGLLPAVVLFFLPGGFYLLIKKGCRASRSESVQALFVFVVMMFVVLTATGAWLRGPGMELLYSFQSQVAR